MTRARRPQDRRRRRICPAAREAGRRSLGAVSSRAGSGARDRSSTCSCTCRSSSSSCSLQRHEPAASPIWDGVQLRVVRRRAGRSGRPEGPVQQLRRRDPERVPGHGLRDDGGARAPARRQAGPARLRCPDLHEHHRPRDRHRPVDPGPVRDRLRLRSTTVVRDQAQLRAPDDHRGPRAVQHQPRAAARPGPAVGDGPDARRGQLATCSRRRGGPSARSRSRCSCRRSWPGSCWRSRSASTTT